MRELASIRTGSTNGFSVILAFMTSSMVISRLPLIFKSMSGAIPPKIGKREASTSTFPTILIKRSESFLQMLILTSTEIPFKSWRRSGSPPSYKSDLGEAANLRVSSKF
jgi:hypothetical protein